MAGHLSLVLHAHLPWVRHPEYEEFLEEDWLYEAIAETYLPLLEVFGRLVDERIPFRMTLTMTPPLVGMLRDPLLVSRFERRLHRLIELSEKEVVRTRTDGHAQFLARWYLDHFCGLLRQFVEVHRRDVVGAFAKLQDEGVLEIVTCGATHGFLPLMRTTPQAVRAQISVAANSHRRHFGRDAKGIWLAECGYYPGVERYLAEEGIRYFFVDTHGLLDATPRPAWGCHAPLYTPSGPAAFGRDPESSQAVWSKESGYPGHPSYREFYRDIGFDLPFEHVGPYVQPTGDRKNTGIKYHRITGKTDKKGLWNPFEAREVAARHAADFMQRRVAQFEQLGRTMGRKPPIVVSPYDAELYGHWWFEGPWFLDFLIRKSVFDQRAYSLSTPLDYLSAVPVNQEAQPPMCSWGAGGYAGVWLDASNAWIYRHLASCTARMISLADEQSEPDALTTRALNQAARELLLAQSSDWAFIIKTGTMVEYAEKRTKEHVLRFGRLHDQIRARAIDLTWLEAIEQRDRLFPELDWKVYRSRPGEPRPQA